MYNLIMYKYDGLILKIVTKRLHHSTNLFKRKEAGLTYK